jgi:hypothetical protein
LTSTALSGDLPQVNSLVEIHLGARLADASGAGLVPGGSGEAHAFGGKSRIEDLLDGPEPNGFPRYVVAAPRYTGDLEAPRPGAAGYLQWSTWAGLWFVPVRFEEERATAVGLKVWEVQVTGQPERNQRRSYVRVPWRVPVQVKVIAAVSGPATAGHTSNISEGGMLVRFVDVTLPAGSQVSIEFALEGERFEIPAEICWSAPAKETVAARPEGQKGPTIESAVSFVDRQADRDRLRPRLFAEQLRQRRQES